MRAALILLAFAAVFVVASPSADKKKSKKTGKTPAAAAAADVPAADPAPTYTDAEDDDDGVGDQARMSIPPHERPPINVPNPAHVWLLQAQARTNAAVLEHRNADEKTRGLKTGGGGGTHRLSNIALWQKQKQKGSDEIVRSPGLGAA
ncbi:hypothetical protein PC9H_006972 [Pleurotus ostreatus]|uniref:Uncharacterized protein n=1 Tax=Pleurotus ostreatus TaxID=5322 RepID=A0A8H7DRZ9_PLEOS|nr:uncharacterized protein PC9H_006972 [Pleurotus ostreatus]KAF7431250.1 hypothetical protein PC9H_006972 [Pleurotus ostreatus]